MNLDKFNSESFDRGASFLKECIWVIIEGLLFSSWVPGSGWRIFILKLFGAKVERGVIIKPHVRVKFPWRLRIGAYSWIGESVWIDNLCNVTIGDNVCISQGVYICTGSHDWSSHGFELITKSISIENNAWICANSSIAPGVNLGRGSILGFSSVATKSLDPWSINSGNPAKLIKYRKLI